MYPAKAAHLACPQTLPGGRAQRCGRPGRLSPVNSPSARAASRLAQSADRSVVLAALRGLPRRQREVLVLRYYADLDVAEVAGTLGITPSAVRSTTTRGLAALARVLRED
jgi:RNA polymerase sigma factor (sigma-70 family)